MSHPSRTVRGMSTSTTTTYRATRGWTNRASKSLGTHRRFAEKYRMPMSPLHLADGPTGLEEGAEVVALCGDRVLVVDDQLQLNMGRCSECGEIQRRRNA